MLENINEDIIHDKLTTQEYHEYQILLAEAKYKNFLPQCNYKELTDARIYFDSLTSLYKKNNDILYLCSRAYYYMAVCEEEMDKTTEAFKNYLNSLNAIEKINLNNKNGLYIIKHFKALIYTRLGDILYWHDAYESSIECIENANKLFILNKNNQNALSRNNIILAVIYGLNNNHDKALYHLYIADSILDNSEIDFTLKNDIERIKASVMYNIGYKDEAFQSVLNQYNTLDNPKQIMEAAGVLGDIYYDKKIYDSAIYYYEKYFPDNKYSKINAANNIIEISIKTGNKELIAKYAPSLAEETNKEIMLSAMKTKLTSLYHQYKTNVQNKLFYNKLIKHFALLLFFTLTIFFFGLNMIKLKKKKIQQEIDEKKKYISVLQEKIDKNSSEKKYIKYRIKNLENEITDIKKQHDYITFEKKLETIKNDPIYKRLYDISIDNSIKTNTKYPELILSQSDQNAIIDLFNNTFDNNLNKIILENDGLKHYDMLYFCLYIIGFDEKHISAVTGKTYNTVWNRTKKIQEILGSEKGIREIIKNKI